MFCSSQSALMIQSSIPVMLTVARIALVKPDKARGVEDVILRAAQMGQIVEKVLSNYTVFPATQLIRGILGNRLRP